MTFVVSLQAHELGSPHPPCEAERMDAMRALGLLEEVLDPTNPTVC